MNAKDRNKHFEELYRKIEAARSSLFSEYSDTEFCIPETEKWDYAIPENYTNFQDGFLFPDFETYRGAPIFDLPEVGRVYIRWDVPFHALESHEAEKYLCFDRHGNKYTVTILKAEDMKNGNPSYFRFLPKVKKYNPKRKKGANQ